MQRVKERAIELLSSGTVDRVLGWKAGEFFYDLTPAVFSSPQEAESAFEYGVFSGANLSKYLIAESRRGGKIAVFLKPGDSYNHNLSSNNMVIRTPLYAVGHGTNDCYQVYEGSVVGLKTSWGDATRRTAIANLTVSENSPLVGATFTGEEYVADMVTFTNAAGDNITRLVYKDGENYKCIDNGEIKDLKLQRLNVKKRLLLIKKLQKQNLI